MTASAVGEGRRVCDTEDVQGLLQSILFCNPVVSKLQSASHLLQQSSHNFSNRQVSRWTRTDLLTFSMSPEIQSNNNDTYLVPKLLTEVLNESLLLSLTVYD